MPLIGIKNEMLNHDIQIIPYKGLPIKSNWSLIWTEDKRQLPVFAAYLAHLKENKSQIAYSEFSWYEQ